MIYSRAMWLKADLAISVCSDLVQKIHSTLCTNTQAEGYNYTSGLKFENLSQAQSIRSSLLLLFLQAVHGLDGSIVVEVEATELHVTQNSFLCFAHITLPSTMYGHLCIRSHDSVVETFGPLEMSNCRFRCLLCPPWAKKHLSVRHHILRFLLLQWHILE